MTLHSADNRPGRGRVITATLASGVLAAGLMAGVGSTVAHADPMDPAIPTVPNLPVDAAAIVPNGVTGEAARAAAAGPGPADPAAAGPVAADPANPAVPGAATEAPPQTADEVLAIIYRDYDTGSGGGQLSKLIHSVMQMRSQGFKPSQANRDAIVAALDHRPNQGPLVEALKETLATQQKQKAQADAIQGNGGGSPFTIGIYPGEPGYSGGLVLIPES